MRSLYFLAHINPNNLQATFSYNYDLKYNFTIEEFRLILLEALSPKTEVFFEADREEDYNDEEDI